MIFYRKSMVRLVSLTLATIGFALIAEISLADTSSAAQSNGPAGSPSDPETIDNAATDDDNINLALMIEYVILHDVAVLEGLLPPPYGTVWEIVEFGSNIVLKHIPPWLVAPPNQRVDPRGPPGPGYSVDGCGIEFELLSAQASYANSSAL